nr:HrgA protein [Limimaricola litoreus]
MTAREIAQWIMKAHPLECEEKKLRSKARVTPIDTDDALLQQIVAEIGSQRPRLQAVHPDVKTTEGRPRRYYSTKKSDAEEVAIAEETGSEVETNASTLPFTENDLYPLLSQYLATEHGVYTKRIDERRSSNRKGQNGNRWLYPDLVGMEDLSRKWHAEVKDCAIEYFDKKTKLWSFEVKKLLNSSNVRECYFQAVSNSSWANLGYLVAAEIEGADTVRELRMLSSLHGIGVMKLDRENPSESQIFVPAKERPGVDWNTANRLVEENPDYLEFVRLVRQFYQTGDPRKRDWDYYEKR